MEARGIPMDKIIEVKQDLYEVYKNINNGCNKERG
jgi:hypothetical protein